MDDNRVSYRWLAVGYALICGGPGAIGSFSALWLQSQGYTSEEVSHIIGGMLCSVVIFNLFLGYIARNIQFIQNLLYVLSVIYISGSIFIEIIPMIWSHVLGWILISLAISGFVPLLDALNLSLVQSSPHVFYQLRSISSLSFFFGSIIVGFTSYLFGIDHILGLWLIFFSIFTVFFVIFFVRFLNKSILIPKIVQSKHTQKHNISIPLERLVMIILTALAGLLIESSHGMNILSMLAWKSRGYDAGLCAALWQVGEIANIVFLFALGKRSISPRSLLFLGGVAATIRWVGFSSSPSLSVFFILQLLNALSFTGTYVATTQLLDRILPKEWRAANQLIGWALFLYFPKAIVILSCGHLYATSGIAAFSWMALLSISGIFIFLLSVWWEKNHLRRQETWRARRAIN